MAFPYTADLGVFANWRTTFSLSVDSANMLFDISATSSGREFSLGQTSGGRCSTHNMRLIIYVCRDTNGKSNFYMMQSFSHHPFKPRVILLILAFQTRPWANSHYSNERRRLGADKRDVTCVHGDVTHIRACRGRIGTRLTLIITWFHILVTLNSGWIFLTFFIDSKCITSPVVSTVPPTKTVTVCPTSTQAAFVSPSVTKLTYCSGIDLFSLYVLFS